MKILHKKFIYQTCVLIMMGKVNHLAVRQNQHRIACT